MATKTNTVHANAPALNSWKQKLISYPLLLAAYKNYRFLKYAFREGLWQMCLGSSRNAGHAGHQSIRTWDVAIPSVKSALDLTAFLRDQGLQFREGGHAIYIPPQESMHRLFPSFQTAYPADVGFKVLKDFRKPEDAHYLTGDSRSFFRDKIMGTWHDRMLAANYLHAYSRGPRVWDVCEWRGKSNSFTVFVVEHVSGATPTRQQCAEFMNWLKLQTQGELLRVLALNWENHEDFVSPECNGNLIATDGGELAYVDFQNFGVTSQVAWLQQIAREGKQKLHFGEGRAFRGKHYLYQSIPGLAAAGKRNTSKRWLLVSNLLGSAGLQVKDRLVMDVGCNSGMMLQAALADGAAWCLGWDRPEVAQHTHKLLLGLGRSRFNVFGGELSPQYSLESDIPESCRPLLDESIILYLSVHQHFGVLESLNRLPWRAIVFEGHQGESIEGVERLVEPLVERGATIVCREQCGDGDSSPRPLLVLTRPVLEPMRHIVRHCASHSVSRAT